MSIEELEVEIKKYYIEWNEYWAPTIKVLSVKLEFISGNDYSGELAVIDSYGEMIYCINVVYDGENYSTTMKTESRRLVKVYPKRVTSNIRKEIKNPSQGKRQKF